MFKTENGLKLEWRAGRRLEYSYLVNRFKGEMTSDSGGYHIRVKVIVIVEHFVNLCFTLASLLT